MYRIGLFSKINKVTVKTLRYYDEAGLLKPAYVDEENGYRYYTSEQLPVLHQIVALRQIGFSIEEIAGILGGRNVHGIYEQRRAELRAEIDESHRQLRMIEHYLDQINGGIGMETQVAIKELPEVIVYSKRMVIPNYDAYFQLVPQIGKDVVQANPGLKLAEPEYCFVIYHDGEYKERDIDVEFCEAVSSWGEPAGDIVFKKVERVPSAACLFHKGPYSTIREAYGHLFKWIEENGYAVAGPPRESYIDGKWNRSDEQDWLTELQVPVVRKDGAAE